MVTRQWVRFNDDARAQRNRKNYIAKHGGEFIKGRRGWEWHEETKSTTTTAQTTTRTTTTAQNAGEDET